MHSQNRRSIVACALAALAGLAGMAHGQAAPNQAVEGLLKGVSAAKDSFTVTAKKADMTVRVNADTRYILDDMPSDAAQALLVGYDVKAVMAADGNAFVVIVSSVAIKGSVKEVAADRQSFVITTKKDGDVTVKLSGATRFKLDKLTAGEDAVLAPGNAVTVNMAPEGTAADVVAKTAKPARTPPGAAPPPAIPPAAQPPAN